MIDRSIMVALLTILDQLSGVSIEEATLLDEVALKCPFALTTDQVREHIQEAERQGWASRQEGMLRERRWARTAAGIVALRGLRRTP